VAVSGGLEKLTSEKAGAAETKRDVLMFWSNDARAATPAHNQAGLFQGQSLDPYRIMLRLERNLPSAFNGCAPPSWLVRLFHGRIADGTSFTVGVACGLGEVQVPVSLAQQDLPFLSIWKFADLTAWIGVVGCEGGGRATWSSTDHSQSPEIPLAVSSAACDSATDFLQSKTAQ
jgi:hypothetical protein